jgi:hypothetical protein
LAAVKPRKRHTCHSIPSNGLKTPIARGRILSRLADLRGRAVAVNIWDFTRINCLRSLPYETAWQRAYRDWPVTFVGVHTPEFEFAKDRRPVEGCLAELVVAVARLAGQAELAALPGRLGPLRDEDHTDAVCTRRTPELHGGYHQGAVGNSEEYLPGSLPLFYQMPARYLRQDGYFDAERALRAGHDFMALAGEHGSLILTYHAASVNAVLAASADPVEVMVDFKPTARLRITQDGAPLDAVNAGVDVRLKAGQFCLAVDAPRLYEIAHNPDARAHEVRLDVLARGVALFAFSFTAGSV